MAGLIRFLSRAAPRAAPETTADALFVFAGGQARKEHAAAAWRRGAAPALVVSVGRFEWRRYALLGLPGVEALRAEVERVPPPERHFFVILERGAVAVVPVTVRPFGTRTEARALAALARERRWRSLIAVTSEFHLRRVALVTGRALGGSGIAVAYAAPAPGADPHGPGRWWRTRRGAGLVLGEVVKLLVYTAFLGP